MLRAYGETHQSGNTHRLISDDKGGFISHSYINGNSWFIIHYLSANSTIESVHRNQQLNN